MAVVVGYDGSEVSKRAVAFAAQEAHTRRLPLQVITAWDQPMVDLGMGAGSVVDPDLSQVIENRALEVVAEGAELARAACAEVTTAVVAGPAAAALVQHSQGADAVVVGSHRRQMMADLLLGGVSRQVATHAACPVFVVRGQRETHKRLAVGIDGSPGARRALDFAFDEASRRGWSLRVVHAWDVAVIGFDVDSSTYPRGGILDDVREVETRLSAELLAGHTARYPDVDVQIRVERGSAARVLVDAADDCDLLVCGSRGRGGFSALLLGSVSHKVLHHCPCTVAIVP